MRIELKFNGETFVKEAKDVTKTILEFKPEQLHTDMYVTITKDDNVIERHLNLQQGKNIFNNREHLQIFVNNLML